MATEDLLKNVPRETGGTEAFRAFDYQIHASMKRVLEAFTNGEEFAAFFDFFDDLIVVHEDDSNSSISFYQVKARKGSTWTSARLAQRGSKGDLPKSVIGKAYFNLHQFGSLVRKAAITSNQALNAKYSDGTKVQIDDGEILFSKLSDEDRDTLVTAMSLDFPNGLDPRHAEVLCYERIPLDIESFRQTLLGLVAEMLEKIDPAYAVAAKPLYDALLSELTRCTGKKVNAKTLAELRQQKSMGAADIASVIDRIRRRSITPMEWWATVESELVRNGWKAIALRRFYNGALAYWHARERGSGPTLDFSETCSHHVAAQLDNLSESIVDALVLLRTSWTGPIPTGETYTLESAFLVELMDAIA